MCFASAQPVFATSTNTYEEVADTYLSALVENDAETAYSMIAPYKVDNGMNQTLTLVSSLDEFKKIMESSPVVAYTINKVVEDGDGAVINVNIKSDDSVYITDLRVDNVNNGYRINLGESEAEDIKERNKPERVVRATPSSEAQSMPKSSSDVVDTYSFSYLFGNINGQDKFDLKKNDRPTFSGTQYDDEYPNREYDIEVRYRIKAPNAFGLSSVITDVLGVGNGSIDEIGDTLKKDYYNCFIYITNSTDSEYVRVKGSGRVYR